MNASFVDGFVHALCRARCFILHPDDLEAVQRDARLRYGRGVGACVQSLGIPKQVGAFACALVSLSMMASETDLLQNVLSKNGLCGCDRCAECFQELQIMAAGFGSHEAVRARLMDSHCFLVEEKREQDDGPDAAEASSPAAAVPSLSLPSPPPNVSEHRPAKRLKIVALSPSTAAQPSDTF